MNSPEAESWFALHTEKGQELDDALRSGKPIPKEFEQGLFAISAQCARCRKDILPPEVPRRCSACKAVIYCSAKCSTADWKSGLLPGLPGHKKMCADFKRHMQRLPETEAVILSFPWGRLEKGGNFNQDIARGRFGVLGGKGYGFWSFRGGPVPHANNGGPGEPMTQMAWKMASPAAREMAGHFHHLDGYDLVHRKNHLSDEEGWGLDPEYIPYRDFSKIPKERWPCLVTEFEGGVRDWDSWYRWRKIPKDSPAALLMTYPLSVYQLVVHSLKFTGPKAGGPKEPQILRITLLGAEVELNFLPLFSELALLLPYHTILITVWGPEVHKLAQEMRKQGIPSSPLRNAANQQNVVFLYKAPPELGGSAVVIMLHSDVPLWTNDAFIDIIENQESVAGLFKPAMPDVMIALNAGIGAYTSWGEVILSAHTGGIPFAVTDYLELSVEGCVKELFPRVMTAPPKRPHDTAYNPFHRPGQRMYGSYKMPNLVNGFSLVVVDRKHFLPKPPVIT